MATSSILTGGYGSFGGVNYLPTLGFASGSATGKGKTVGGNLWARAMVQHLMAQRERESLISKMKIEELKLNREVEIITNLKHKRQANARAFAAYSVLLAEL